MPDRIALRVPACPRCERDDHVSLQTNMRGEAVFLTWCCRACSSEWPARDGERIERRVGLADRRASSRTNRRTEN